MNGLNLDIVAGLLCGWVAFCLFSLWIVSNPRRRNWMTIPPYVRGGFLVTGLMFFWRSIDFLEGAHRGGQLGHINAVGMMPLLTMTYTFTALSWWWFHSQLPGPGWHRLEWVKALFAKHPETTVMPADRADVMRQAKAAGIVVLSPPEPSEPPK